MFAKEISLLNHQIKTMKSVLLLVVATCLGAVFYNQFTDPNNQPKTDKGKINVDSSISENLNDSISAEAKHYEKHNNVPE